MNQFGMNQFGIVQPQQFGMQPNPYAMPNQAGMFGQQPGMYGQQQQQLQNQQMPTKDPDEVYPVPKKLISPLQPGEYPTDCNHLYNLGAKDNGVFYIKPRDVIKKVRYAKFVLENLIYLLQCTVTLWENVLFGKTCTFWEKMHFFGKKMHFFWKKCTFWVKMHFLGKNALFRKKCTFWKKMHFLGKNALFGKKCTFWEKSVTLWESVILWGVTLWESVILWGVTLWGHALYLTYRFA